MKEYGHLPFVVPTSGIVSIGEGGHVNGGQSPFKWGEIRDVYIGATQPLPKPPSPPPLPKAHHASQVGSQEVAAKKHYVKVLADKHTEVKIKITTEKNTKAFTLSREDRSKRKERTVKERKLESKSERFKLKATYAQKMRESAAKHAAGTLKSVLTIAAKEYNDKAAVRGELTAKVNMGKILEKQEEAMGHSEVGAKHRTKTQVRAQEKTKKVFIQKEINDKKGLIQSDLRAEVTCKATERKKKDSMKRRVEKRTRLMNSKEGALKKFVSDYK